MGQLLRASLRSESIFLPSFQRAYACLLQCPGGQKGRGSVCVQCFRPGRAGRQQHWINISGKGLHFGHSLLPVPIQDSHREGAMLPASASVALCESKSTHQQISQSFPFTPRTVYQISSWWWLHPRTAWEQGTLVKNLVLVAGAPRFKSQLCLDNWVILDGLFNILKPQLLRNNNLFHRGAARIIVKIYKVFSKFQGFFLGKVETFLGSLSHSILP